MHKWQGCAKYTIHHLAFSSMNPLYAYVAGLDCECVCGRWDDSRMATCSGNANSSKGGHGRAAGPNLQKDKEDEEGSLAGVSGQGSKGEGQRCHGMLHTHV